MDGPPKRDRERFARNERIARRHDFLEAYSRGAKTHSRHAVIFVLPNELGHPRVGITVTKKVGKAVIRNRIKRRVREIYRRSIRRSLPDTAAVDLIINMKRTAAEADFSELERDLTRAVLTACDRLRHGR